MVHHIFAYEYCAIETSHEGTSPDNRVLQSDSDLLDIQSQSQNLKAVRLVWGIKNLRTRAWSEVPLSTGEYPTIVLCEAKAICNT